MQLSVACQVGTTSSADTNLCENVSKPFMQERHILAELQACAALLGAATVLQISLERLYSALPQAVEAALHAVSVAQGTDSEALDLWRLKGRPVQVLSAYTETRWTQQVGSNPRLTG